MKKTIALVGAGALIVTLGLGTGFAQQGSTSSTPAPSTVAQPKASTPEDPVKEKVPASKPAAATATEAAMKPAVESPADKGTMVKPPAESAADKGKTVAAKPEADSKTEKNVTASAPAGKEGEKAVVEKTLAPKTEQAVPAEKTKAEASADKKEESKPAVK